MTICQFAKLSQLDKDTISTINRLELKADGKDQVGIIQGSCENLKCVRESVFELDLQLTDKVLALMLGSQASFDATLEYVRNTIEWAKTSLEKDAPPHYLFVFCGRHNQGDPNSLLQATYKLVQEAKSKNPSSNLVIVPLSFQDAEQIAPILARADMTITRSGGLTAMELLEVATGKICIHVVDKKSKAQIDEKGIITNEEEILKQGMLYWEGGNEIYLKERKGARLMTPESLQKSLRDIFKASHSVPATA